MAAIALQRRDWLMHCEAVIICSNYAYGSDKLFAEAIEVHCGVPKGRALKELGNGLSFMPPQEDYRDTVKFSAMYECLIEAIIYVAAKRELTIGLIGNAEMREGNSK